LPGVSSDMGWQRGPSLGLCGTGRKTRNSVSRFGYALFIFILLFIFAFSLPPFHLCFSSSLSPL
ncbi:MAG: hypothetical protein QF886_14455, partial [Planctomycetota bacterium]|nr:hypothetical protein [Planctomycetota bacterium]